MFCQSCGQQASASTQFCPSCGKPLSAAPRPSGPAPPLQPETSGKAIASLILGFFSLFFPAAVLAVVFGHLSRSEIRRSAGRLKGSGIALAGLLLGYLGVAMIPLLIIAAIAIPNLLRSRMAANESSGMASLRTLNTALITYYANYGEYPPTLETLAPPPGGAPADAQAADLLDPQLASGTKSGYVFEYTPVDTDGNGVWHDYVLTAEPLQPNRTGRRYFYTDSTAIIRMETNRPATRDSPPL